MTTITNAGTLILQYDISCEGLSQNKAQILMYFKIVQIFAHLFEIIIKSFKTGLN